MGDRRWRQRVETVYIPEDDRATLCVSCRWGVRWSVNSVPPPSRALIQPAGIGNYRPGVACGENCRRAKVTGQRPITNVVMMGMGERCST